MEFDTLELVYIWFNARTELYDLEVSHIRSPNDPDCAIPEGWGRKWSIDYYKSLRGFVESLFGKQVFSSPEWKELSRRYERMKNKRLFEIYEHLSEESKFDFIWELLEDYANPSKKFNEDDYIIL